jgi:hypothetical protein
MLLFVVVLTCTAALGADLNSIRKEAAEIIGAYGGSDRILNSAEFRSYVGDKAFDDIDADEDEQLVFEEYFGAHLYIHLGTNQAWTVNAAEAKGRFSEDKGTGRLDANQIYITNEAWRSTIDHRAATMFNAASGGGAFIDEDALVEYFARPATSSDGPATPKTRLMHLRQLCGIDETARVKEEHFNALYVVEQFTALDVDQSTQIDLYEWSTVAHSKMLEDFIVVSGRDFLVSSNEYTSMAARKPNTAERYYLLDGGMQEEWEDYSPVENSRGEEEISQSALLKGFEDVYQIQVAEAKTKQGLTILGFPWLQNQGIVLRRGGAYYDKVDEAFRLSETKPAVVLRLVKDFNTANDKAESAVLNWSKDAGTNGIWSADAALRFDFHIPGLHRDDFWLTPAAGVAVEKSGQGDEEKELYKFFGLLDLDIFHDLPVLKSSHFQIGPVYEYERSKDIQKLTGLIEWDPHLRVGSLATGVPYPLLGLNDVRLYSYPVLAVELNNVNVQPAPKEGEDPISDASFARYGLKAGLKIGERVSCSYMWSKRSSIDRGKSDHTYYEGAIEYFLDDHERFSVKGSYEKGENSPDFERVEKFAVGLGIKF